MKTVGIFDSGMGGKKFELELLKIHPEYSTMVVHDQENLPYGEKTESEIQRLTEKAIQPILGSDVVVIACNTATAYAIDYLRTKYPDQKFVGFEPAIKTASNLTKSNVVSVFATPATLKSRRYILLKNLYSNKIKIIEPDLSLLAQQIESGAIDWQYIEDIIASLKAKSTDCIVLGCTHYDLIKDRVQALVGQKVNIISPTSAVIRQLEKL